MIFNEFNKAGPDEEQVFGTPNGGESQPPLFYQSPLQMMTYYQEKLKEQQNFLEQQLRQQDEYYKAMLA